MASKPIQTLVDELPESNLTTRMLAALDFVAPGQYHNLVGFEKTIRTLTGTKDDARVQKIGERAIALYNDRSQGYQRALWLYQTTESMNNVLATAALANKVGEKFRLLSLLAKVTPKADTSQTIDFCVKLVVEGVAYCLINGLPGDSTKDFVKALAHSYKNEALIRMAALICIDGLLPLGPDYLGKVVNLIHHTGATQLAGNSTFQKVSSLIPGGDAAAKLGFMQQSVGAVKDWMTSFTSQHALSQSKILGSLKGFLEVSDDRLDYVAALVDVTTNYFEHTGIQTVARSLVDRAVNEI
jgi:hypothetical protein